MQILLWLYGGNPKKDHITSGYFDGNIYLARIYNRVLSENEVKQNYNYDNQNYNINDKYYENLEINDVSYEIASVTDLEKFRDEVNRGNTFEGIYVELKNDLDLSNITSWIPIGNENIAFKGIFNGNGYKIFNLNIDNSSSYQGLFGNSAGIIENLNIKSGNIKGTYNVGSIAGLNSGTIINCSNEATINTTSYNTGGICGYNSGNIERNFNKGYVHSNSQSLGGILGRDEGGIVKFCYNTGVIDSTSYNIGGIVGTVKEGTVSSCYNVGNISTTGYNTNNNSCIAGIVGNIAENIISTIKFCYNTGDITGEKSYVGGISSNGTNISYCYNTGKIVSKGGNKSKDDSYAGGIIARCQHSGMSIKYCYNLGTVTCTDGNKYPGGIAGATISGVTVSNCYTLSSAISTIIGNDKGTSTNNEAKSESNMKNESFITSLGGASYWYLSGGYPKLIWE